MLLDNIGTFLIFFSLIQNGKCIYNVSTSRFLRELKTENRFFSFFSCFVARLERRRRFSSFFSKIRRREEVADLKHFYVTLPNVATTKMTHFFNGLTSLIKGVVDNPVKGLVTFVYSFVFGVNR